MTGNTSVVVWAAAFGTRLFTEFVLTNPFANAIIISITTILVFYALTWTTRATRLVTRARRRCITEIDNSRLNTVATFLVADGKVGVETVRIVLTTTTLTFDLTPILGITKFTNFAVRHCRTRLMTHGVSAISRTNAVHVINAPTDLFALASIGTCLETWTLTIVDTAKLDTLSAFTHSADVTWVVLITRVRAAVCQAISIAKTISLIATE